MGVRVRAFVLLLIGFFGALFAGEFGLRAFDEELPDPSDWPTAESEFKYHQLIEDGRDMEAVFLGSSFIEAGIDPEQFSSGLEAYNLGMPFSSIETTRFWLEDVVFPRADPRFVVLGIPVWQGPDSPETSLTSALKRAEERDSVRTFSGLKLWQERGALGTLDMRLARERLLSSQPWTESGHQTAYWHGRVDRGDWQVRSPARFETVSVAGLSDLTTLVQAEGAQLVLLVEPVAHSIAPEEGATKSFLSALMVFAEEHNSLVVQPPSEFWEDDKYVDGVHFNGPAAVEFSHFVDRAIQQMSGRL